MKDLRQAIQNESAKKVAEAVPLPTKKDFDRIVQIIQAYRRASIRLTGVDEVAQYRDDAIRNHQIAGNNYEHLCLGSG